MKIRVFKCVEFECEVDLKENSALVENVRILANDGDVDLGNFSMSDIAVSSVGTEALRVAKELV